MGGSMEDLDKIKQSWAYNMPCVLLINGGKQYWDTRIRQIYDKLYKDVLLSVRKTLASSLLEIMKQAQLKKQKPNSFNDDLNSVLNSTAKKQDPLKDDETIEESKDLDANKNTMGESLLTESITVGASRADLHDELDEIQQDDENKNGEFFIEVLLHFMKDSDEIRDRIMPNLCEIIS